MTHSLIWFIENGCELQRPSVAVIREIYRLSGGTPCNGCNCKATCPAWPLVDKSLDAVQHPFSSRETNAAVAARLGITKRQASKLRRRV